MAPLRELDLRSSGQRPCKSNNAGMERIIVARDHSDRCVCAERAGVGNGIILRKICRRGIRSGVDGPSLLVAGPYCRANCSGRVNYGLDTSLLSKELHIHPWKYPSHLSSEAVLPRFIR